MISFKEFCSLYSYDLRSDMARESYCCFNLCFNVITQKKPNYALLGFLGLKCYA